MVMFERACMGGSRWGEGLPPQHTVSNVVRSKWQLILHDESEICSLKTGFHAGNSEADRVIGPFDISVFCGKGNYRIEIKKRSLGGEVIIITHENHSNKYLFFCERIGVNLIKFNFSLIRHGTIIGMLFCYLC